jgi:hypothetical protein
MLALREFSVSAVAVRARKPKVVAAAAAEQQDDNDAPAAVKAAKSADYGVVTAVEAAKAAAAAEQQYDQPATITAKAAESSESRTHIQSSSFF